MSLFIYEMKKMFFYQKGLLLIGIYFTLSVIALFAFDMPQRIDVELNLSQYNYYLNQVKGPLSEETKLLLSNESEKISNAKVMLEKAYNEYYDGKSSEEQLFNTTSSLEKIIGNESGFKSIFEQYTYIRENPDNRYFLPTNGWDGLLSTDSLDLLFLLLLLLLITPVFCSEYASDMDSLHLTVKKGTHAHIASKILLVTVTVIMLCLVSTLFNYAFFQTKYGLENGDYPLQSLSYFGNSTKSLSLFSAYLFSSVLKTFGYLSFGFLIMLISVWSKKYALTLFSATAVTLLPYFGFSMASSKYYVPGPLGFMVSTGFFRGSEEKYNVFNDQTYIVFKEVSISVMVILFILTVCMNIAAIFVIIIRHTNVWGRGRYRSIRNKSILSILGLMVASLVGCTPESEPKSYSVYNYSDRHRFENEQYRFYVDETELDDIRLVFEDKETGEINHLIRNPLQSLTKSESPIYGNGSYVYYMEYSLEKSGFRDLAELDRFSIVEVNTTTFDEQTIFGKNINTEKNSFFGANKVGMTNYNLYFGIDAFFLDEKSIYLIDQDQIRQVNRLTGNSRVIIRAPLLTSVAFDGQFIYYINEKYQVVKYDVQTDFETVIPDIISSNFVLTDTELLFLNRQDKFKIYGMDLNDFTTKKITEKSVLSFTVEDQTIFYEDRNDLKKYRIDKDGQNEVHVESRD